MSISGSSCFVLDGVDADLLEANFEIRCKHCSSTDMCLTSVSIPRGEDIDSLDVVPVEVVLRCRGCGNFAKLASSILYED